MRYIDNYYREFRFLLQIDSDSTLHIYVLDANDKQIMHKKYFNVDSIAHAEELVRNEKLDMLANLIR